MSQVVVSALQAAGSNDFAITCRDYVRSELDSGYEGPLYLEPLSMNRFTTALIGELQTSL